jgi:hypothetical protein
MNKYIIIALPFPQSDATSEYVEYARTEEDAQKQFEARNPTFRVKEVRLG